MLVRQTRRVVIWWMLLQIEEIVSWTYINEDKDLTDSLAAKSWEPGV